MPPPPPRAARAKEWVDEVALTEKDGFNGKEGGGVFLMYPTVPRRTWDKQLKTQHLLYMVCVTFV